MVSSERITVRLGDDLDAVDQLVDSGVFQNRSEAIRAAVDGLLDEYPDAQTDQAGRPANADPRRPLAVDGDD